MLISIHIVCVNKHIVSIHIVFFLFLHCFLYYYYLTNLHTVCVNKHTYIIFRFCTERCDPPHERCRHQPATGMGTAASGLYEGDFAPSVHIYRMTYHNRMVLCHVRRGGTHLRGVAPSRTAPPPAPGGGEQTRRVYMGWMYLWVWPG